MIRARALPALLALTLILGGCAAGSTPDEAQTESLDEAIPDPTPEELDALSDVRVFFGHQSVGANVLSGVDALYAETGRSAPSVVETKEAVGDDGAFLAHAFVGVNGDPASKIDEFSAILDGPLGEQVDVALLKFCYLDVTAHTDVENVFAEYTAMMDDLAQSRPDVRLVYTTVPLTTAPDWKARLKAFLGLGPEHSADNAARQRYNALIRERYEESGRLFDIAVVEASGAGDALDPALASDNGHLNDSGARAAAAALVHVIAGASEGR